MLKFPHHRFTVTRQKSAESEFQRNRWPGWLQFNVDFAMDGTIPPPGGRSQQSDHWTPMGYTLFVNIVDWLHTDLWIDRKSSLNIGDAVTVEPSCASQANTTEPAPGSYWAEIVSKPTPSDGIEMEKWVYGVRRYEASGDAPLEMIERQYLRHRKLHTKAFIHVSDDKVHDSYAAQTFVSKTLMHLDEHYAQTGNEKFVALRLHSDNAPSHFKTSKTMHYLTTLVEKLTSWGQPSAMIPVRIVWEFGPPGHGKGVWDGIGAWMKRTVRQDVIDHSTANPTVLTSNGHILSPAQVAEHLQARFQTNEFICTHLLSTINEVIVEYTHTRQIVRPQPDHVYDSLPGMKKTFLFQAVREGVLLMRSFSCWCCACFRAWGAGMGTMDSNYHCQQCESLQLTWNEVSIERTDAAGISNMRKRSLAKARQLTKQLQAHFARSNVPVWVAVQNRGEEDQDQYWIGRAIRIEKVHSRIGSVEGTAGRVRYDIGDCEIAVEWFERDEVSGGQERRIFKRREGHNVYTFNSTELRLIYNAEAGPSAIQLEMTLLPPVGGVPLNTVQHIGSRTSSRLMVAPRLNYGNVRRVVQQQRADPPEQLWELSSGSERAILDHCW